MIKRKSATWTTIQCPSCKDCWKVLNDRFKLALHCPYCDAKLDLKVYRETAPGAQGALKSNKIDCGAIITPAGILV